jgi:hypothetical protein
MTLSQVAPQERLSARGYHLADGRAQFRYDALANTLVETPNSFLKLIPEWNWFYGHSGLSLMVVY